jgi:nitronate monooxygenase
MKSVDDFRLRFGKKELVPIVIGGMGVDISTAELALEAARLGGIGHISDAMVNTVADRRFNAKFVKDKLRQYKFNVANSDKSMVASISGSSPRRPRCTSAEPWRRSVATA